MITRPAGAVTLLAIALGLGAAAASGGYGGGHGPIEPNPCKGELSELLLCPDLQMAPPSEMYATSGHGRVLLNATNNVESRGEGPLEVRGERVGKRKMEVEQVIHTSNGKKRLFDTHANLVFYEVPGLGSYWKFRQAARFELWTINSQGDAKKRVRTGPKLNYCFRDLERTEPSAKSPPGPVYPACSQDPAKKGRTLGTSVGWSDIYPSGYYQNWVNVKGMSGCFLFIHRADPLNDLYENKEGNNTGEARVQLPPTKKGKIRDC
ncbi:MAG: hypothetical protein EXQ70_10940 [Solirubrobacterales bacterium]|nr:hypothetical protein [Solirubrobacterales bacterium]